jgi:hypothetical protein
VLVNLLAQEYNVDLNGVIMLSQILNFDLSVDDPEGNPGIDLPYIVALPTYAASAWYHHNCPAEFSRRARTFRQRSGRVRHARLCARAGGRSDSAESRTPGHCRKTARLHRLPVSYILKANLRIDGGEFAKNLEEDTDTTTGRLDTRFSGPTMDPLSKKADYDPQAAPSARPMSLLSMTT